ncbi:MAG: hypothetical protein ACK55K_05350, partial [Bacteroidota bacterium]
KSILPFDFKTNAMAANQTKWQEEACLSATKFGPDVVSTEFYSGRCRVVVGVFVGIDELPFWRTVVTGIFFEIVGEN